jgi:hypothetical protein
MTGMKKVLPLVLMLILAGALAHSGLVCDADVHIYSSESSFRKQKGMLYEGDAETLAGTRGWSYSADGRYSCEEPKYIEERHKAACYLCSNGTVMCVSPNAAKKLLRNEAPK